ncbi:MAG: response regulator [Actinomycetota bacterium]|nr:response regulator [Actinomycetota bacterium]
MRRVSATQHANLALGVEMANVLVVDDDEDIRDIVALRLGVVGHTVRQASNGDECLEAIESERPDIILLDIQMPRMNGIDVCRNIKANPEFSLIPVLLLTARGQESDVSKGFDAGADDYIVKPFSLQELQSRVERFLRVSR